MTMLLVPKTAAAASNVVRLFLVFFSLFFFDMKDVLFVLVSGEPVFGGVFCFCFVCFCFSCRVST